MTPKKKSVPAEEVVEVAETVEVKPKAAKKAVKKTTKADVVVSGKVVRTYTKEVHGDKFESLAGQFAKKTGGTVTAL